MKSLPSGSLKKRFKEGGHLDPVLKYQNFGFEEGNKEWVEAGRRNSFQFSHGKLKAIGTKEQSELFDVPGAKGSGTDT